MKKLLIALIASTIIGCSDDTSNDCSEMLNTALDNYYEHHDDNISNERKWIHLKSAISINTSKCDLEACMMVGEALMFEDTRLKTEGKNVDWSAWAEILDLFSQGCNSLQFNQ